jgi:ABC-2 type transport system ATP-binding protein
LGRTGREDHDTEDPFRHHAPKRGEARVLGFVPWARKKEFRRQISIVMGQRSQLWPDLPALESFDLNRAIYEIDRAEYRRTLDELVSLLGVSEQLQVQVRRSRSASG